jgi:glycosyltransferase involved in cell wall biosynthesis
VGKPLRSDIAEPIEDFPFVPVSSPNLQNIAYAAPRGIAGMLSDLDSYLFSKRTIGRLLAGDHDLIHISGDPLFSRFVSRFNIPVTTTMHGSPYSFTYDRLHPWLTSCKLLKKFDSVVAGGTTVSAIQQRADIDVRHIDPGVDTDLFNPDGPAVNFDRPTILFVGRLVPSKNIFELLQGFKKVQNAVPSAQLVIIGKGPLRSRIEHSVDSFGLSESVFFCGYISNSKLPAYYRGADVFAISSDYESFGMVLLEAMSCGTPVVGPSIDYIPEIVPNGKCGILYKKGDVTELADALTYILKSPDIADQLGRNGQDFISSRHTWSQKAAKLHKTFIEMVD